ncbi:MAG: hypothetical protein Q8P05_06195 [Candidatus Diapherotrites archaeon]|nr:hypothetical protein [Candidatus Diapherotrites archaeon]
MPKKPNRRRDRNPRDKWIELRKQLKPLSEDIRGLKQTLGKMSHVPLQNFRSIDGIVLNLLNVITFSNAVSEYADLRIRRISKIISWLKRHPGSLQDNMVLQMGVQMQQMKDLKWTYAFRGNPSIAIHKATEIENNLYDSAQAKSELEVISRQMAIARKSNQKLYYSRLKKYYISQNLMKTIIDINIYTNQLYLAEEFNLMVRNEPPELLREKLRLLQTQKKKLERLLRK